MKEKKKPKANKEKLESLIKKDVKLDAKLLKKNSPKKGKY